MSDDIHPVSPPPRMRPSGTIRLLKPACNGSAQLSYFIYSCTVRTRTHRRTPAQRQHARVDSRPNVLCIRSTMSNSQRTEIREQMSDTCSPTELSNSSFSRGHSGIALRTKNQTRDHLSSVFCSLSSEAGGAERIRTDDPLLAKQVLSQLSYSPESDVRRQRSENRTLLSSVICSLISVL